MDAKRIGAVVGFGIAIALSAVCCSKDGRMESGSSLVGPTESAAFHEANLARITLPFDASNFTNPAANPYFPITPGTEWSYVEHTDEGIETNTVEVTHQTKTILGVSVHVVHDRVYLNGSLKEDTFDWYAGDNDGNVWYFGEDTKEIENGGVISTEGSWEAGKAGAQAGIIMLADPKVGDTYYQENAPGVVADQGKVQSLKETAVVPYGTFYPCLQTSEWTHLEPGNRSAKYYAAGIGVVLEVTPSGGQHRVELVGFTPGR